LTLQRYGDFYTYGGHKMKCKRTNCELHELYVLFMNCTENEGKKLGQCGIFIRSKWFCFVWAMPFMLCLLIFICERTPNDYKQSNHNQLSLANKTKYKMRYRV